METIKFTLKNASQTKTYRAVICFLLAVFLLTACEKPTPPNDGTTTPNDTIIADEFIPQWEEVSMDSNHYCRILLSFDSSINRLHSRVTLSGDYYFKILWGNGWIDYTMKNDTMYYIQSYSQEEENLYSYGYPPMLTWKITNPADSLMEMRYLGIRLADATHIYDYLFHRIK